MPRAASNVSKASTASTASSRTAAKPARAARTAPPAGTARQVKPAKALPATRPAAKPAAAKVTAAPVKAVKTVKAVTPVKAVKTIEPTPVAQASRAAKPVSKPAPAPAPVAEVIPLRPKRGTRRASRARLVVPVALGSLTQPGARQGACCQACGSRRVTSLALTLTDGTPVEFTSCHACEHRSWYSPTGELDRATVLDKTRKVR